ncbi:ADP-ribosylglycohydrolase family protein [Prevotella sp. PINT]|jgi:ADP-ribosylglycohydrolase|uniref:ADP-ribosylglycohydrolase family protein n=1 Tax=Palleniella intestinalis TaxID=2736291 RepID=UPI0015539AD7|nr:ADP-ribosylglycohydrolase family protein [Palleniella intestinalis]NPD81812.1 ADP-ribosylglycohydrolase family protein [Palleniella intestinalis]
MLGAIIGDIVGSTYEFHNIKTKEFPFFPEYSNYTDDSILTLATADWLLHGGDVAHLYSNYAAKNDASYGGMFILWVARSQTKGDFTPYNSCGNGSAMRVSPVGWAFDTKEEVLHHARLSAECTHNHPEGIKGAQATALCIFMARNGASKDEIRKAIESEFNYDLSLSIDEIRPRYSWGGLDDAGNGGTCQGSVPQAIRAFLDGTDFEDCIRNAISIGGDSDTIGCITGSIAEAYYGIPQDIREKAMGYLPTEFQSLVTEFEAKYSTNNDKSNSLFHTLRQFFLKIIGVAKTP